MTQSAQSTPSTQRIAVIGGGVSAHSALKAFLAAHGDDAPATSVDIYSREPHRPYRRPSVNKDILIDGKSAEDVSLPGAVFDGADNVDVTLHLSSEVSAVDTTARTLTVDGEERSWDHLVFATGASPRTLDSAWLDGRDVHYIRTPEHSAALRGSLDGLGADDNVVIIGAGILGLEAAAAATELTEARVTVLEMQDDICRRMLPAAGAEWLRSKHTERGVDFRCGLSDEQLSEAVSELDPAAVVVSVGLERDITLAREAGLDVARGIVTDEFGRTGTPGVWAAGDCVEIRVDGVTVTLPEDEGSARQLGGIVGNLLAGKDVDSFLQSPLKGWSRQYGLMLNLVGGTGRPQEGEQAERELVLHREDDEIAVLTMSPRPGGDSVVSGVTTVGRSPVIRKAKNALGMSLKDVESEFFDDEALMDATT